MSLAHVFVWHIATLSDIHSLTARGRVEKRDGNKKKPRKILAQVLKITQLFPNDLSIFIGKRAANCHGIISVSILFGAVSSSPTCIRRWSQ